MSSSNTRFLNDLREEIDDKTLELNWFSAPTLFTMYT